MLNEGVDRCRILYYMAFVLTGHGVKRREELAVVFPHLLPRLDVLRGVWQETNAMLAAEE